MAGPTTEVLNEDLGELKADLKELKGEMARLTNELTEMRADLRVVGDLKGDVKELKGDVKALKDETARLAIGQAEMRTELRITLGLGKWAAGFVIATALGSGLSGVWWASGITAEVKHLAEVVATSKAQPPPPVLPTPAQPMPVPKAE